MVIENAKSWQAKSHLSTSAEPFTLTMTNAVTHYSSNLIAQLPNRHGYKIPRMIFCHKTILLSQCMLSIMGPTHLSWYLLHQWLNKAYSAYLWRYSGGKWPLFHKQKPRYLRYGNKYSRKSIKHLKCVNAPQRLTDVCERNGSCFHQWQLHFEVGLW